MVVPWLYCGRTAVVLWSCCRYFRNWALLGTTARSDHTVQMAMHMADKEFLAQIYQQTAHEMQAQEADK